MYHALEKMEERGLLFCALPMLVFVTRLTSILFVLSKAEFPISCFTETHLD